MADSNSAVGQLTNVYSNLETYFQSVVSHLESNAVLGTLDTVTDTKVDEALSLSVLSTETGASDRVGVLVESVHTLAAVTRENAMATMDRIQIYAEALNEAKIDVEVMKSTGYSSVATFKTGV